ncbi:hypothetical protein PVAND_015840 [Polypedilum vanderplanki]|uniref:Elongation of very long chain fatty acids protein n=1 Tax=Polypedilum vanderplanki TaxID=319348 RepID=A0A9J6BDB1_POLVA|nr:hypothetical protein PVAND_015840 [Polypedilum vanderplanki]
MLEITESLINFWINYGDARTSKWFLTKSLFPIFVIIFIYLLLVLVILPKYLNSRKYENVRKLLAFYYFIHSGISLVFLVTHMYIWYLSKENMWCMKLKQDFEGIHYYGAIFMYFWLWFKITEMFETILMIFIYGRAPIFQYLHHSLHPLALVIGLHFSPGGTTSIWGCINNIEHVILYFIFALRNISEKFKKSSNRWFKKFHLIGSINSLVVALVIFLLLEKGPNCDPYPIKLYTIICIFIFLCASIGCRWGYISQDDAFGKTKFVIFINLGLKNLQKNLVKKTFIKFRN